MLRVAVPNKGALSEAASSMLAEAGYRQRRDSRELVLVDPENEIEFFFLRPRDIAVYVGSGTLDVGITGRDLLLDSEANAVEIMNLGFAGSTFRFAARPGTASGVEELQGKRIATSYPGLVRAHLARHDGKDWHLHASPSDAPLAARLRLETAFALVDVIRADETERLRECGAEDCDGVLLDLSRNRSKRFCSQRCANRTNMTAYRRRQASDTDERPDSASGA